MALGSDGLPIEYIMRILGNCLLRSTPIIIFWSVGRLIVLRKRQAQGKQTPLKREIWLWILVIYLIMLLQITVFRFGLHWVPLDVARTTNMQPLVTLRLLTPWAQFYNIVGNIVWFVPLGLALPQVFPNCRLWQVLLLGALLSVTIESLLYLFYTGISDIDDVIFNTLGAVTGWLMRSVCHLVLKLRRKAKKKLVK